MVEISFDELCNRLAKVKDTLILSHTNPDADTIGSMFALKCLLEKTGSRAYGACADALPKRLAFLNCDKNSQFFQENVSIDYLPENFNPTRIISVDVASPNQLGNLKEIYSDKIDLMIDHHENGIRFADNYVEPFTSAAGEIIYKISREFQKRGLINEIPKEVDFCIYAAISADTGCFKYSNVTPETHLIAADLLRSDIDPAYINHKLFVSKSLEIMKVESAAVDRIHFYADGKVAIVDFPFELMQSLGATKEDLETVIDIARSPENVLVAAAVKQYDNIAKFNVSMRSACDFDVSKICALFGGGGHCRAAGCRISAPSADEAVKMLIEKILPEFEKNNF